LKDLKDTLSKITTASIPASRGPGSSVRAFTLRFVPAREDLATPEAGRRRSRPAPPSRRCRRAAIAVVDAMGVTDAGIFGDILCARMAKRGVAALVTDGVVRDAAGVLGTGLPVWCQGAAAPPRSPGSPSSTGRSRSAAAASRCSRTTSSWSTTTARC
jgi:dienelactone hydrolase